jgi:hypothetical protein
MTSLTADEFFLAFAALLSSRRAALKKQVSIGFAVIDAGSYVVDTRSQQIVTEGWRDDVDASIVCNERTLSDMLVGRFDPTNPGEDHLFVWSGDDAVWETLESALSGAQSMLALRAGQSKKR